MANSTPTGEVKISLFADVFENNARAKALQVLANLDIDTLQKLEQLANSKKAIEMLVSKWKTLKLLVGL